MKKDHSTKEDDEEMQRLIDEGYKKYHEQNPNQGKSEKLLVVTTLFLIILSVISIMFLLKSNNIEKPIKTVPKLSSFIQQASNISTNETFQDIIKPVIEEKTYKGIHLSNGMQVILISDPDTTTSSAGVNVQVGSFADPSYMQGLAHFCEHMVFLKSKKYPEINGFQTYVANSGGSTNAFTRVEDTNFYFQVAPGAFEEALDRFSNFFLSPIFTKEKMSDEANAVDGEFHRDLNTQSWKQRFLLTITSHPNSTLSVFNIGSYDSLITFPQENDIDILKELQTFYNKHYSANLMSAVIMHNRTIEELEKLARAAFSGVENKNTERPSYFDKPLPFSGEYGKKFVQYIPYDPTRAVNFFFTVNSSLAHPFLEPYGYLSKILSDKSPGGFLNYLVRQGFAGDVQAGISVSTREYNIYSVEIYLSLNGIKNLEKVAKIFFAYIDLILKEGITEERYYQFAQINNYTFHYMPNQQKMMHRLAGFLSNLWVLPPQYCISGSSVANEFDKELLTQYISQFTPDNLIIFVRDPNFTISESPTDTFKRSFIQTNSHTHHKNHKGRLKNKFSQEINVTDQVNSTEQAGQIQTNTTDQRNLTIPNNTTDQANSPEQVNTPQINPPEQTTVTNTPGQVDNKSTDQENLTQQTNITDQSNVTIQINTTDQASSTQVNATNQPIPPEQNNTTDTTVQVNTPNQANNTEQAIVTTQSGEQTNITVQDNTTNQTVTTNQTNSTNQTNPNKLTFKELDLFDSLYEIHYGVSDIPEGFLDELKNVTYKDFPQLNLPILNEFVSDSFRIVQRGCPMGMIECKDDFKSDADQKEPTVVHENDTVRVWHQLDRSTKSPRIVGAIRFHSKKFRDLINTAVSYVKIYIVTFVLDETLYQARQAGNTVSINPHTIEIEAFSDTFYDVLYAVLEKFKNFNFTEYEFSRGKQRAISNLYHQLADTPYENLLKVKNKLLFEHYFFDTEISEAVANLTYNQTKSLIEDLYGSLYSEVLFVGNMFDCEAKIYGQEIPNIMGYMPPEEKALKNKIRNITGNNLVYRMNNPLGGNQSFILNSYQDGVVNIPNLSYMQLLVEAMKMEVFTYLRTEQKICYFVQTSSERTRNILSLNIIVESSSLNPHEIDEHIEIALQRTQNKLLNLTDADFAGLVKSLQETMEDKDLTLRERANAYFSHITNQDYVFDLKYRILDFLPSSTKTGLLGYFSYLVKTPRKLSIQFYNENYKELPTETLPKEKQFSKTDAVLITDPEMMNMFDLFPTEFDISYNDPDSA